MTPFNLCQIASIAAMLAIIAFATLNGAKESVIYISITFFATSGLLVLGKILTH